MHSKLFVFAGAALLLFAPICARAGDAAPAVSIDRALALANESLAKRHADAWIRSVTLETSGLFSKKASWIVKWSHFITGSGPKVREIGLAIKMDGSVEHLVEEQ